MVRNILSLFIALGSLITDCSYSQSLNSHGKLGTNAAEYVSTNGSLGTSKIINSNGKTDVLVLGQIIVDNLAPSGTTTFINYPNIQIWGQQFMPSIGGLLANVKVNLYTSNPQSGVFTIELWSDNGASGHGNFPSSKLVTLYSSNWENVELNNTSAIINIYPFVENYSLVSGTSYWLVVNQDRNGPAARRWATTGSGIGQTASYNMNSGLWTNYGSTSNLGLQIAVTP